MPLTKDDFMELIEKIALDDKMRPADRLKACDLGIKYLTSPSWFNSNEVGESPSVILVRSLIMKELSDGERWGDGECERWLREHGIEPTPTNVTIANELASLTH